MSLPKSFQRAVERSTLLQAIFRSVRRARSSARVTDLLDRGKTASAVGERWVETSVVATHGRAKGKKFLKGVDESRLSRTIELVLAWTRSSFLFRWLTAEPEPEVIVIDLRDTVTIGPIIAAMDRVFRTFAPAAAESGLGRLGATVAAAIRRAPLRVFSLLAIVALAGTTVASAAFAGLSPIGLFVRVAILVLLLPGLLVRRSWSELRSTRPVRLVIAALEPPPPPESSPQDADEARADESESTDSRNRQS